MPRAGLGHTGSRPADTLTLLCMRSLGRVGNIRRKSSPFEKFQAVETGVCTTRVVCGAYFFTNRKDVVCAGISASAILAPLLALMEHFSGWPFTWAVQEFQDVGRFHLSVRGTS